LEGYLAGFLAAKLVAKNGFCNIYPHAAIQAKEYRGENFTTNARRVLVIPLLVLDLSNGARSCANKIQSL